MPRQKQAPSFSVTLMGCAIVIAAFTLAAGVERKTEKLWLMAGQNLQNTHFQRDDSQLRKKDLDRLRVKWVFETREIISATAAVDKRSLYIPDWSGLLFKIDRRDGSLVWQVDLGEITGLPTNASRTSPAVYEDLVIVGDLGGFFLAGAKLMAFDRETGALRWLRQVDSHGAAFFTQAPVVHDGIIYVGVSSLETFFATNPSYPCCTFRGSLVALDVYSGDILWQTYFTPPPPPGYDLSTDGPWYSGTAIWGSTVAIDEKRNSVYVATGQNYTVPQPVLDCVQEANDTGGDPRLCNDPGNLFDSIAALDMTTGAIKWGSPRLPFDAWTVACLVGPAEHCPSPQGPDYDFAQGPSLFTTKSGRELVGAGQKSGEYWALDPDTGDVVWHTQVGPGGLAGGLQWGSAVDGERIYVAEANNDGAVWNLVNPAPDSPMTSTTGGGWSALDAETGEILWQTADPNGAIAWSPVSVNRDGIVFVCSMDPQGHMYALDAKTGTRLWSFASGGSCVAGAALVDKDVYWGSGYIGPGGAGTPNNQLYAFGK